jgi:hypothetical protein
MTCPGNTVILNGTYAPGGIEYRWCKGFVIADNLTDGKIRQRDGGDAREENNVTVKEYSIFKNASGTRSSRSVATISHQILRRIRESGPNDCSSIALG